MSEVLSTVIFGILFQGISLFVEGKEKYVTSLIVQYLAAYMYVSLAYSTYSLLLVDYTKYIFIGLAFSLFTDILFNLHYVVDERYQKWVYYGGFATAAIRCLFFMVFFVPECNNLLLAVIGSAVITGIVYGLVLHKKDIEPLEIGIDCTTIFTTFMVMFTVLLIIMSNAKFSYCIFAIGSAFMSVGSIFLLLSQHSKKAPFVFNCIYQMLWVIANILITASTVFILY